jgi:hypothetical protein
LYAVDLSPLSEISSNCFNDSYTAMDFRTFSGATLPLIRNNFLYNYNYVGINVVGYSGNIGTLSPADPGLNTLWSNYNPAIDINSNTNITVADNFGMFNISWPTVQITSNRPFHSTASCSQQIFNMPSQGNLNVNYTCDNFRDLFTSLSGSAGNFSLAEDYNEKLHASVNPFDDAALVLGSIEEIQPGLLQEMTSLPGITENEKAILNFYYYYRKADYSNAKISIIHYIPENEDESDFRSLCLIDLDILGQGWEILDGSAIGLLKSISEKASANSNYAISILNNSPDYRDYLFDVVELPGVMASANVKHIDYEEQYLLIRPNPSNDKVFVEYLAGSLADARIQVYDVSGQMLHHFSARSLSGGFELDISDLSEGFYFVTITDTGTGAVRTGKLVKSGNTRN